MKVLVTGGAGFIGSNLSRRLSNDGHQVTSVDDFSSATWENLVNFDGDVLTCSMFEDISPIASAGPFDVVFHEASITDTTVMDQRKMMSNNVEAFRKLLELCIAWKCRLVWASSCSIYGQGPVPMREDQPPQPLNVYAFSKLAMERLASSFMVRLAQPIVALRYSNVYGPGEAHKGKFASMIHQLARQMRAGKRPRVFTAGQQKRDFVYIDDVVEANVRAMSSRRSGVYNAGAGASWSFNEVITELNRALKTRLQPEYFDNPYGFTQDWTETDVSRSREAFGYAPQFDLKRGIDAYLESGKLGI